MFITILEESCVQKESCLWYQEASVLVRKVLLWGCTLAQDSSCKDKDAFSVFKWLHLNQRSQWDSIHNAERDGFLLSHSSALWHKERIGIWPIQPWLQLLFTKSFVAAGKRLSCLWLNSNLLLNHFSLWMALVLCSCKSKKCYFLLVSIVNCLIWIDIRRG